MIQVRGTEQAIRDAQRRLSEIPGGINTALSHSFNRALTAGRAAGVREGGKIYTLKQKHLRDSMLLKRASKADLSAALVCSGANLPLRYFEVKPGRDTTGAKRAQVYVSVRRDTGLKPLGQAFVWKGLVMQRLGQSRLPVEQKYTVSPPQILDNDTVREAVIEAMTETVDKRLDYETERLLAKGAK